jgi:hypothetical protein
MQMIYGQDLITRDDFDDCHDKATVEGLNFISIQSIFCHYLQGEGRYWALPTRTITSGHQSRQRL